MRLSIINPYIKYLNQSKLKSYPRSIAYIIKNHQIAVNPPISKKNIVDSRLWIWRLNNTLNKLKGRGVKTESAVEIIIK